MHPLARHIKMHLEDMKDPWLHRDFYPALLYLGSTFGGFGHKCPLMGWPPPEPPGCAHCAVRCTAGQSQAGLGFYLPSVHILQAKRRDVWALWGLAQGCPESSPGFSNKTNNFPTSLYRAVGMTMGKTTRQSCSQPVPSMGPGCYCPVAMSLSPLL